MATPNQVHSLWIANISVCTTWSKLELTVSIAGQELTNETDPEPELRHAFNICTINARNLPEEPLPGFSDQIAGLAKDFKALAGFVLQSLAIGLGECCISLCTSVKQYKVLIRKSKILYFQEVKKPLFSLYNNMILRVVALRPKRIVCPLNGFTY